MSLALIVDGSSLLYRCLYALPRLTTSDGRPTGAVFGATRALTKLVRDLRPSYWALALDSFPTFRHQLYEGYKAGHDRPQEITPQFGYLHEVADILGLPSFRVGGFEADDVVASLTSFFLDSNCEVVIESTDSDLFVLVQGDVVLHTVNGVIGIEEVRKRFGVEPSQISDYKALVGDTSDEVPGIKGLGESRVRKILSVFKNVEEIRDNPEKLGQIEPSVRAIIEANVSDIFKWKSLTQLRRPELDIDLERCRVGRWDGDLFIKKLKSFEFAAPVEFLINLEKGVMNYAEETTLRE
jgi:DNA polymerase-1